MGTGFVEWPFTNVAFLARLAACSGCVSAMYYGADFVNKSLPGVVKFILMDKHSLAFRPLRILAFKLGRPFFFGSEILLLR